MQLKGKQIKDGSIEQQKLNVITDTITDKNSVTNNDFVKTDSVNKVNMVDYSTLNLNMQANNATIGDKACETHVIEFPIGIVQVKVNSVPVTIGLDKDCYFSPDGATIRDGGNAEKGDYLYWNSDGYDLDTDDEIDFIYLKSSDYYELDAGETVEFDENYNNIVVKYNGDSGTTMTVIIDEISFTVGNVGGSFVWDIGGANEHTFTSPNESYVQEINGQDYYIWFDGFGSLFYSIRKQTNLIVEGFGFITNKQGNFSPEIITSDGSVATWEITGENDQTTNTPNYILDGTPKVVKITIADFSKIETFDINNCGVNGNIDMTDLTGARYIYSNENPLFESVTLPESQYMLEMNFNDTQITSLNIDEVNGQYFHTGNYVYIGLRNNGMSEQEVETFISQCESEDAIDSWSGVYVDLRGNARPTLERINGLLYNFQNTQSVTFWVNPIQEEMTITFTDTSYSRSASYWGFMSKYIEYPTWEVVETGEKQTTTSPQFTGLPTGTKTLKVTNFGLIKSSAFLPINTVGNVDFQGIVLDDGFDISLSNNTNVTGLVNMYGGVGELNLYGSVITNIDLSTIMIRETFNIASSSVVSFSGLTAYEDNIISFRGDNNTAITGVIDFNNTKLSSINFRYAVNVTNVTNIGEVDANFITYFNGCNITGVLDLRGIGVRYIDVTDNNNLTNILIDKVDSSETYSNVFVLSNTGMDGDTIGQFIQNVDTYTSGRTDSSNSKITVREDSDFIPLSYESVIEDMIYNKNWKIYYNSSVTCTFQTNKNGTFTPTILNDTNYSFLWSVSGEADQDVNNPSWVLDGTTRTVTLKNAPFARNMNLASEDVLDNPDFRNYSKYLEYYGTNTSLTLTNNTAITEIQLPDQITQLYISNCNISEEFSLTGTTIATLYIGGNPNVLTIKDFIIHPDGLYSLAYNGTGISGVIDLQNFSFNYTSSASLCRLVLSDTAITDVINLNSPSGMRSVDFANTNITGNIDLSNIVSVEDIDMENTQISGITFANATTRSSATLNFRNCNMSDAQVLDLLNGIDLNYVSNSSSIDIRGNSILSADTLLQKGKMLAANWDIDDDDNQSLIMATKQTGSFTPSVVTKDASIVEWTVEDYGSQTSNTPSFTLDGSGTERVFVVTDARQINEIDLSGTVISSNRTTVNSFKNVEFSGGTINFSNIVNPTTTYIRDIKGTITELNASNSRFYFAQSSGYKLFIEGDVYFDGFQTTNSNLGVLSLTGVNIYARNSALTNLQSSYSETYIDNVIDCSGTTTLTNFGIYWRTNNPNGVDIIAPNNKSLNRNINFQFLKVNNVNFENCSLNDLAFSQYNDGCVINLKDNDMIESDVDYILNNADLRGAINGTIVLDGTNAAPSATGLTYKSSLEGKGWTVTVTV